MEKKGFLQFIKFGLVGVSNTIVDFVVYTVLVTFTPLSYVLSQVISYTCGVLNSYLLNTAWTFREERKRNIKEFAEFVLVNVVSLGVSIGILYLCTNYVFADGVLAQGLMDISGGLFDTVEKAIEILSKIVATPIAIIVNFVGNKLLVFRKSGGEGTGADDVR
ncbi:MAG: GtrA family protein [Clostridia bacterium]|nr:GtrA family protein [Clostridia bacterium]